MTTPGNKPWTVRPWIVITGIICLYTSYSIMLKAIGLSSQAGKSLRPYIHRAFGDSGWGSTPKPMSPGKCNLTHFLTSGVPDRLGAQMSNYATLLIHSQRLEIIPFFPKRQKQILSAIFRFGQYIHTTKYLTNDMFTTAIFLY